MKLWVGQPPSRVAPWNCNYLCNNLKQIWPLSKNFKGKLHFNKKTEFSYCVIIYCFMEYIQKLLCEMPVVFICASKNTRTTRLSSYFGAPHHSKLFKCSSSLAKGELRMRTARGIICRHNWIADYTIRMIVHKIT